MAITKEITRLEKSNVKLTITVPNNDVRTQYQDMLKEYTKTMQIPGFRKGKVPQEVLERKYADALKGDALGRIIESAMKEIMEEGESLPRNERPLPYSTPELQDEPKLDLDQDFQFSVVYDVLPEVKLGQWKGLKVEHRYAEVEKDDLNRELEEIRERNAIIMDRDDNAAAKKGDIATVDYSVFGENIETLPETERKNFVFTIGSDHNMYQFDDDIIKMKKGETKEIQKKYPDNHEFHVLAGMTLKFQVTLTALKEKKLPDLDDDFAQDVDEKFNTLDDLKNSIKERLNKNLENRLRDVKLEAVMQEVMKNTPVLLPESMIQAELDGRWRRMARYYNAKPEAIKQMMCSTEEQMQKWRDISEKALHSRMIIETIIEEQNIEVTDDEIEKEIERIADEHNVEIEEVRKNYDEQSILYLKEEIKERRITDIMLAENTLKAGKKENYLDFMSDKG